MKKQDFGDVFSDVELLNTDLRDSINRHTSEMELKAVVEETVARGALARRKRRIKKAHKGLSALIKFCSDTRIREMYELLGQLHQEAGLVLFSLVDTLTVATDQFPDDEVFHRWISCESTVDEIHFSVRHEGGFPSNLEATIYLKESSFIECSFSNEELQRISVEDFLNLIYVDEKTNLFSEHEVAKSKEWRGMIFQFLEDCSQPVKFQRHMRVALAKMRDALL